MISIERAALLAPLALGLLVEGGRAQGCEGQRLPDVPDGYMVVEGDIQVRVDACLTEGVWEPSFWPNGDVPYLFNANVSAANQAQALTAMGYWEAVADVDFRPWAGEPSWVLIQDSTANNSAVGMQGGLQIVNVTSWNNTYVIAHELGHLLGFYHEHARPDQAQFIQVNYGNVCQNCCVDSLGNPVSCNGQFLPQLLAGVYGPYDFDSVMHYGQFAFSANGSPTITVLPPNTAWQSLIGQRNHLSEWDARVMSFLYPFADYTFVDRTDGGSLNFGTFFEPYTSLSLGILATPDDGTVWILQPSDYPDVGVFDQPRVLRAPVGGVVIGS